MVTVSVLKEFNETASLTQGFSFLVKFGLVLNYILKDFIKKKACLIHYLHFPFKKHVPSQVLIDLSVENLETAPGTFLSKVSSKIYLLHFINYWSSIFILYLRWRAFNLVFILSALFFFLSSFLFFFCRYSCFLDTKYSQDSREGRGNQLFSCFLITPAHEHSFSSSRFVSLLFNRSICNY